MMGGDLSTTLQEAILREFKIADEQWKRRRQEEREKKIERIAPILHGFRNEALRHLVSTGRMPGPLVAEVKPYLVAYADLPDILKAKIRAEAAHIVDVLEER